MYHVRRRSVIVILMAFVLILILSAMYSRSNPPAFLYVFYVVVSLIVANLLALLGVRLHRLESEAVTDPLTGAFNRRYFEKRLSQEMKRVERMGRPMAMLFMDIDNFKGYNDQFGHSAGDEAVKRLVETVSQCVREMDIIARHGGEEFVVLLPEAELEAATTVAERIREMLSAGGVTIPKEGKHSLTVTIGVAAYRTRESAAAFLHRADQAMYQGKLKGKNQTALDAQDAKGTILIVDDEVSIREVCSRTLTREGFLVNMAESGETAIDQLSRETPDLVIVDMNMPGISGLDVLRILRRDRPGTPAISISGSLTEDEAQTLQSMGKVQILGKPFQVDDLMESVRKALGGVS